MTDIQYHAINIVIDETVDVIIVAAGNIGPVGPPGAPGVDGTDGVDGVDGAPGTPGSAGASGPPGADGADGAPGPPGATGATGATGPPGADGGGAANVLGFSATWQGYLPKVTPYSGAVWQVPYIHGDSKTFDLTRFYARVEMPGSGDVHFKLDLSNAGHFVSIDNYVLFIGGGLYENQQADPTELFAVTSGQLLRISFITYPMPTFPNQTPYSVLVEGEEP